MKFFYKINKEYSSRQAQSIVEYTLMVGILVGLLVAMMPLMRRAINGMVKTMADQIGNQQNADQVGGLTGHLDDSHSMVWFDQEKHEREYLGTINYEYTRETTQTESAVVSNLGFSRRNP